MNLPKPFCPHLAMVVVSEVAFGNEEILNVVIIFIAVVARFFSPCNSNSLTEKGFMLF